MEKCIKNHKMIIKKAMKYFQNLSSYQRYIIIVKFNLNIKFKLNMQMTEKVQMNLKR